MILFGGEGSVETILERLELTSGTNDKIEVLKQHKDKPELRAYLDVALNPYRVYHIKKLPTDVSSVTAVNQATIKDIYSLGGLAKYLESKRGLRSEDLDLVYYYFDGLPSNLKKKWAEKAILKKAIAGIGVKTVNKAFGEIFLPEHNVMLMSAWEEPLENIKYPVYVQRKLDGFRCTYIPEVGFLGRSGRPLANFNIPAHFNMGDVVSTRENIINKLASVFDGEVYSHKRGFNEIASILSAANKPIPEDIEFHVFNIIPIADWSKEECPDTYTDQLQLFSMLSEIVSLHKIKFIQTFGAQNAEDLKALYESFLEEGFEGAIVRDPKFTYTWKRATAKSQTIFKLKPHDLLDAIVLDYFEGQDSMTGMLGGLTVNLEDGTTVDVGSGFKERERIEFWADREALPGKWVRVKYTEKTEDGSLRFPVFKGIRDDKE